MNYVTRGAVPAWVEVEVESSPNPGFKLLALERCRLAFLRRNLLRDIIAVEIELEVQPCCATLVATITDPALYNTSHKHPLPATSDPLKQHNALNHNVSHTTISSNLQHLRCDQQLVIGHSSREVLAVPKQNVE
jgi:hypothetical protein